MVVNTIDSEINKLYDITLESSAKTAKTFLFALGKPYSENLISDYLAYILDNSRSQLGVAPLNALLKCVSQYQVTENDTITIEREHCLANDKGNRIDILITIKFNSGKEIYVGIENKIFSEESSNKNGYQTVRYNDALRNKSPYDKSGKDNIGIFLTPNGIPSKDEEQNGSDAIFRSLSYETLINKFKENVKCDNNPYYKDFICHIEKHIINRTFSEADINFINAFSKELAEIAIYKKNRTDEKTNQIYEYAMSLRNKFFDMLEKILKKNLLSEQFEIERQSFYIQFFKKDWKEEGIHFEIIIPYNKGFLFPNAEIFIMLHKEKGKRVELRKEFNTYEEYKKEEDINDLGFNKPENVICGKAYEISKIISDNVNIESKISEMIDEFKIKEKTVCVNNYLGNEEKQIYLEINKKAACFFQKMLCSESAGQARNHLEKWQISADTIKTFGLGYAPEDKQSLTNYLLQEGYTKESLVKSGIAVFTQNENCVDRFQNRIMIPIIDTNENIIGFSGRIVGKGNPIYTNSPETIIFNTSQNLFSLQLAPKNGELILVEGYMDVMFLYQNGIKNAVTTFGIPLTTEQAKLAAKFADKVTVCYDGDAAGKKGTISAIEAFRDLNVQLRVLSLDEGMDPYEFVKSNGAVKFAELLQNAETPENLK